MSGVTIIGIDLAKRVFQLHRAREDGSPGRWMKPPWPKRRYATARSR